MNFTVLWLFTKAFSAKFGGVASFGAVKASNPRNFSPLKVSPIRYYSAARLISIYLLESHGVGLCSLGNTFGWF